MKLISTDNVTYSLDRPEMTIGRDPTSDIMIADPRVSSRHAVVQQEGDACILTDLGSTNGTFVNNSRLVGPYTLTPGDVVSLGGVLLTVQGDATGTYPGMAEVQPAGGYQPSATVYDPRPPTPVAAYPAQPAYTPQPAYPAPMYEPPRFGTGTKDRTLTMVLEILPGLFGLIGIGWIYAGRVGPGVTILVVNLIFVIIFGVVAAFTAGISLCVTWPIEVAVLVTSAIMLNNYTKQHPELFKS